MKIPHGFVTTPFPHLIIDDAFDHARLRSAVAEWPTTSPHWKPHGGRKRSLNDRAKLPPALRDLIDELNSEQTLLKLRMLTGISDLRADHSLSGGGLHETETGGALPMHVDFNRLGAPTDKHRPYRRLNLLLYLNPVWPTTWGGDLWLWDRPHEPVVTRSIAPLFNRVVLFESTEQSWHGHPAPLACPPDVARRSIAAYYYSSQPHPSYCVDHSTVYPSRKGGKLSLAAMKPKGT